MDSKKPSNAPSSSDKPESKDSSKNKSKEALLKEEELVSALPLTALLRAKKTKC